VELQAVKGSGDNGRIIKRDVDNYTPAAKPQQAPAKAAAPVQAFLPAGQEGHTDTPLTQMRRIIAQKLSESKFTRPHFYLTMTITMDKAIESVRRSMTVSGEGVVQRPGDQSMRYCAAQAPGG